MEITQEIINKAEEKYVFAKAELIGIVTLWTKQQEQKHYLYEEKVVVFDFKDGPTKSIYKGFCVWPGDTEPTVLLHHFTKKGKLYKNGACSYRFGSWLYDNIIEKA